jgi:hypothetical protein
VKAQFLEIFHRVLGFDHGAVDLVEPVESQGEEEVTDPLGNEEATQQSVVELPSAPDMAQVELVSGSNYVEPVVAEADDEPFYITQADLDEVAQQEEEVEFIVPEIEEATVAFFALVLHGDVGWVALRSHSDSTEYTPPFNLIPEGDYNLVYRFGASADITYPDTVTVGEGGVTRITCDAAFQNCVPRR